MAMPIAVLVSPRLFCGFGRAIRVQISDDDAPAGLDVTLGNTMTDAARGTSDEGNFTVEFHRPHSSRLEIVVHDLAQAEREVGNDVRGRDDLAHWQCGNRRQRMRLELERRRA